MKSLLSTVIAVILLVGTAHAQFPKKIHYQGALEDAAGPINRPLAASFKIYDAPTGGVAYLFETQTIQVTNGLFSVVLGEFAPLDLPFDKPYWLEISIDNGAPIAPRTPLLATGYAYRALTVPDTSLTTIKINKSGSKPGQGIIATAIGAKWGDVVTHVFPDPSLYVNQNSGDVTIGVTPGGITQNLLANGAVTAAKLAISGIPQNGQVLTFTSDGGGTMKWKAPSSGGFTLPYAGQIEYEGAAFAITNTGNGAAGRFTQDGGVSNTPALQAETIGAGSAFSAITTGIGNAGYFQVNNISGTVPAIFAESNSSKSVAIEGTATHATGKTIGVSGKSLSAADSASGINGQVINAAVGANASGVRGLSANSTANGYGVWGSHSGKGSGVYGNSVLGVGVRAVSRDSVALYALHSSATGNSPALTAETNSASDSSVGVIGRIAATVAGVNSSGVMGVISDTNTKGNGVWGWHSGRGRGVFGSSNRGVGIVGTSADSIGVVGSHTATTGVYPGIRGESNSTAANATAILGVLTPTAPGASSAAVRGINNGTAANGIGVWGSQAGAGTGVAGSSAGGIGVYGNATSTTAVNYGMWGQSSSSVGTGVYASATATDGRNYGLSAQAVSDSGIAVYGVNTNASATAYAGNFKGKVNVSGDITKTYSTTAANPERRAMPICYGTVNANGTIASGTPNFSCNWDGAGYYVIQIEGENYNAANYTTLITPISGNPLIATSSPLTGAFLTVRIFNLTGTNVQNGFSFVVYKP
jgi:hypothetical protein